MKITENQEIQSRVTLEISEQSAREYLTMLEKMEAEFVKTIQETEIKLKQTRIVISDLKHHLD